MSKNLDGKEKEKKEEEESQEKKAIIFYPASQDCRKLALIIRTRIRLILIK